MAEWQTWVDDEVVQTSDQEQEKKYVNTVVDEALRRKLHSAYTFVRSSNENRKLFTLDHLIQERLDMLSLKKTERKDESGNPYKESRQRVSRVELLDKLLEDLKAVYNDLSKAGKS